MSTYYFNIDNSNTTSGTGTNLDPANFTQLGSFLTTSGDINGNTLIDGDIVRIKGTYINPASNDIYTFMPITNSVTMTSWEDNIPWKIDGGSGYVYMYTDKNYKSITFKNAIINSCKINSGYESNSTIVFKNIIFYTSVANGTISDTLLGFFGCTFNNITEFNFSEYYTVNQQNSVGFVECVFIDSIPTDNNDNYGSFLYADCTFTDSYIDVINSISATDTSGSVTFNNCDYDWTPTNTLPSSINDIKSNNIVFSTFGVLDTNNIDRINTWISDEIYSDSFYSVNRKGRGAFYFGEFETTEYYINTSGSNTAPYDTPEKGANSFNDLYSTVSFQNGDIINFVTSGGDVDDTSTSTFTLDKSLTFRNYPLDENKCTWLFDNGGVGFTLSADACSNTSITGLECSAFASIWNDNVDNLLIENCTFDENNVGQSINFKFTKKNTNITFNNNIITSIGNEFIHFYDDVSSFNFSNNVFQNDPFIIINFDNGNTIINSHNNINIYNNITDNSSVGIPFTFNSANVRNLKVYNNTIDRITTYHYLNLNFVDVEDFYFYDNIITSASPFVLNHKSLSGDNSNIQIYDNICTDTISDCFRLDFSDSDNVDNLLIKNNNIIDANNGVYLLLAKGENTNFNILKNKLYNCNSSSIYIDQSLLFNTSILNGINIENNIIRGCFNSPIKIDISTSATIDNQSYSYNNLINTNDTELAEGLLYYSNSNFKMMQQIQEL